MLNSVANASSLNLTTIGRRSGRPHTVTLWFVTHEDKIYVCSDDLRRRDWCRNLLAQPDVSVKVAGGAFRGQARPVEDPDLRRLLTDLRRDKYAGAYMDMVKVFVEISLQGRAP